MSFNWLGRSCLRDRLRDSRRFLLIESHESHLDYIINIRTFLLLSGLRRSSLCSGSGCGGLLCLCRSHLLGHCHFGCLRGGNCCSCRLWLSWGCRSWSGRRNLAHLRSCPLLLLIHQFCDLFRINLRNVNIMSRSCLFLNVFFKHGLDITLARIATSRSSCGFRLRLCGSNGILSLSINQVVNHGISSRSQMKLLWLLSLLSRSGSRFLFLSKRRDSFCGKRFLRRNINFRLGSDLFNFVLLSARLLVFF